MNVPLGSPAHTPLAKRYRQLIWSALDCDLPRTALFYAERYFYSNDPTGGNNHDARHLLAQTMMRCDQVHSAQNVVKDMGCAVCAEVYSQCCTRLGRWRQAEDALRHALNKPRLPEVAVATEPRTTPDEAALVCRAGILAMKANANDIAAKHFLDALSKNPFLWEAVQGLCRLGRCPDIDRLLPLPSDITPLTSHFLPPANGNPSHVRFDDTSRNLRPPPPQMNGSHQRPSPPAPQPSGAGFFTPISNGTQHATQPHAYYQMGANGPIQPFRLGQQLNGGRDAMSSVTNDSSFYGDATFSAIQPMQPTAGPSKHVESNKRTRAQMAIDATSPVKPEKKASRGAAEGALAVFRRSTRLLGGGGSGKNSIKAPPREQRRTRTRSISRDPDHTEEDLHPAVESASSASSALHSPRSEFSPNPPNQNQNHPFSSPPVPDENAIASGVILDLTRRFAKVLRLLTMFEPQLCLDAIDELPEEQKVAPWVSSIVGRARFEMSDYTQASRAFEQARGLDPYRMWDMDVYSTVLWHLQKDVSLSFLAQELVTINDQSPQAWIATGNCFSLQKDHGQALTCFKRATSLDPRCAYGYALSGHEALALDDQESAVGFFRTALRTDGRHYPAWYGLGTVYLKQNKLRKAEYHFRKAIEISPSNAVLVSCEGTVLEKRGHFVEALERFDRSLALSPNSALVKFKRVKVLIALKQYGNALTDLTELRDLAPDEANVPFVLGKLFRIMGRKVDATRAFTVARDLDPKLGAIIGHLLEEMTEEGEGEGDEIVGGGGVAEVSMMDEDG
ncbi:anaphase-promoting complex subunit cdc27 [Tulasnella sp. JGI-2019a]|nr:anaphase-promoting complex subunit cdc27 [Tulasnella sp. JGI-2019a]